MSSASEYNCIVLQCALVFPPGMSFSSAPHAGGTLHMQGDKQAE